MKHENRWFYLRSAFVCFGTLIVTWLGLGYLPTIPMRVIDFILMIVSLIGTYVNSSLFWKHTKH